VMSPKNFQLGPPEKELDPPQAPGRSRLPRGNGNIDQDRRSVAGLPGPVRAVSRMAWKWLKL
jgi:hypothetical protein